MKTTLNIRLFEPQSNWNTVLSIYWITVYLTICFLLNVWFAGHTQRISIPDCVEFDITTNACRGYCVSYSIPSNEETLRVNPNQLLTSVGQCCNIMETEDVSKQQFNV